MSCLLKPLSLHALLPATSLLSFKLQARSYMGNTTGCEGNIREPGQSKAGSTCLIMMAEICSACINSCHKEPHALNSSMGNAGCEGNIRESGQSKAGSA